MTGWWRRRRLRAAEDALADAQHELAHWGDHLGIPPSEKRRMRERVDRAQKRLDRCRAALPRKQASDG